MGKEKLSEKVIVSEITELINSITHLLFRILELSKCQKKQQGDSKLVPSRRRSEDVCTGNEVVGPLILFDFPNYVHALF